MATNSFRLHYLAKAAAGVPRDLVNTFVSAKIHPIRPTVLIYNCTWVCDARCTMCNNWKWGDRKSDMTLAQLEARPYLKPWMESIGTASPITLAGHEDEFNTMWPIVADGVLLSLRDGIDPAEALATVQQELEECCQ